MTMTTEQTNAAGETNRRLREEADPAVLPLTQEPRARDHSLAMIDAELSRRGIKTRQGFEIWHKRHVGRILERAGDAGGD